MPEKIDDLFNLILPPIISGARIRSLDVDIGDDSFLTIGGGGGGGVIVGGRLVVVVDFEFPPLTLLPPKNVTALAVFTDDRIIVSGR